MGNRDKTPDYHFIARQIKQWSQDLGFQGSGITHTDLSEDEKYLHSWLKNNMHGEMHYMSRHGSKRSRPNDLLPGTLSIISVRMDYDPPDCENSNKVLENPELGFISRYALGRDYHKIIRKRLQNLADKIQQLIGSFGYRVYVDSAPVLEKALARNAGLGWIGKHTNLLHHKTGSWFFIGEILTDLPLPVDESFSANFCGTCTACIDICPTRAIIGPYQLDARRCISYLTIELRGSIPEEFRKAIGNRIYGCDDCQLVCPWNKYAKKTTEKDFHVRYKLDSAKLTELFKWTEDEFLTRMEGSAIRRIGYISWLRNIAVALGNAPRSSDVVDSLKLHQNHSSDIVQEHVTWALAQHEVP